MLEIIGLVGDDQHAASAFYVWEYTNLAYVGRLLGVSTWTLDASVDFLPGGRFGIRIIEDGVEIGSGFLMSVDKKVDYLAGKNPRPEMTLTFADHLGNFEDWAFPLSLTNDPISTVTPTGHVAPFSYPVEADPVYSEALTAGAIIGHEAQKAANGTATTGSLTDPVLAEKAKRWVNYGQNDTPVDPHGRDQSIFYDAFSRDNEEANERAAMRPADWLPTTGTPRQIIEGAILRTQAEQQGFYTLLPGSPGPDEKVAPAASITTEGKTVLQVLAEAGELGELAIDSTWVQASDGTERPYFTLRPWRDLSGSIVFGFDDHGTYGFVTSYESTVDRRSPRVDLYSDNGNTTDFPQIKHVADAPSQYLANFSAFLATRGLIDHDEQFDVVALAAQQARTYTPTVVSSQLGYPRRLYQTSSLVAQPRSETPGPGSAPDSKGASLPGEAGGGATLVLPAFPGGSGWSVPTYPFKPIKPSYPPYPVDPPAGYTSGPIVAADGTVVSDPTTTYNWYSGTDKDTYWAQQKKQVDDAYDQTVQSWVTSVLDEYDSFGDAAVQWYADLVTFYRQALDKWRQDRQAVKDAITTNTTPSKVTAVLTISRELRWGVDLKLGDKVGIIEQGNAQPIRQAHITWTNSNGTQTRDMTLYVGTAGAGDNALNEIDPIMFQRVTGALAARR